MCNPHRHQSLSPQVIYKEAVKAQTHQGNQNKNQEEIPKFTKIHRHFLHQKQGKDFNKIPSVSVRSLDVMVLMFPIVEPPMPNIEIRILASIRVLFSSKNKQEIRTLSHKAGYKKRLCFTLLMVEHHKNLLSIKILFIGLCLHICLRSRALEKKLLLVLIKRRLI